MASEDIQYKTLNQLAQLQLDYISANAPVSLTRPVGPFITAVAYAVALVALVLQRLIQLVLRDSRLSTATGDAVDSFVADFGLARGPALKASGEVTFSRLATAPTLIAVAVGTKVATSDIPPVQFVVVPPGISHPTYVPAAKVYAMLPGGTTLTDVPVEALNAGVSGNVGAARINTISSALPGIDGVTNPLAFASGRDADTDDEVRQAFVDYIQGLTRATAAAIAIAINNVSKDLVYSIVEPDPPTGYVSIYLADGAGPASSPLVTAAAASIETVRPVGIRVLANAAINSAYGIVCRVVYGADIVFNVLELQGIIRSAILSYINSVAPGETLHIAPTYKVIFNANSPGDLTTKTIAFSPPSTTTKLILSDVEGLATGQHVKVYGFTTASGELPMIINISGNPTELDESGNPPNIHEVEISPALTAVPTSGTVVEAFSIRAEQIYDVHSLNLGAVVLATDVDNTATSTVIPVTSTSGAVGGVGQLAIITDESDADNFVYYQTDPGTAPANVASVSAGVSITLGAAIGVIDSTGAWVEQAPPVGARVSVIAAGSADVTPSTTQHVIRALASASNAILVQMETE